MNEEKNILDRFWASTGKDVMEELKVTEAGLTSAEVEARVKIYGENNIQSQKKEGPLKIFIKQFKSPITLILLFATGISLGLRDYTDTVIIFSIVMISGILSFFQEYNAGNAVEKLMDIVKIKADVIRNGEKVYVNLEEIVPGDVILLSAGDVIPADCILLEAKELQVDESTLTGETFPVEKNTDTVEEDAPLAKRSNSLWMGTHVISGTGQAVAVKTGGNTEFGEISKHLSGKEQLTDFELGVQKFGSLLLEITILLLLGIFAVNLALRKPVFDSFLFSLALAVGLTPQLLPAIITVNLSHGAKAMAEKKVIVKKLSAIENFGSMNVMCTDKTGTITAGEIKLNSIIDVEGNADEDMELYTYLNSSFQSGYSNPIDKAVLENSKRDTSAYVKVGEIPYNFVDKRMSVAVEKDNQRFLVMKGALENVVETCSKVKIGKDIFEMEALKPRIMDKYRELGESGLRTLGLAVKIREATEPDPLDTSEMVFLGFITLHDPLKEGVVKTTEEMKNLGIDLKIITGDNQFIARSIAKNLNLKTDNILTGPEIAKMSETALRAKVKDISVFAEIEPNQKERVITSLKATGSVVGYMGDGINDASAIHAADVGISVDTAADAAKTVADIVLLEQDLKVLTSGITEGRRTFINTMKYVQMATSANFGNMFSMAGASLFLPFLPLRPTQVLLTNLITDFPEMQIASDNVEEDQLEKPRRWDIHYIKKFMITFGLLSSIFDYATFAVLMFLFGAKEGLFQTGWFSESIISAALMVLVLRTRKSVFKSRPSKKLVIATVISILFTLALPFTGIGELMGFVRMPPSMYAILGLIIILYLALGELIKKQFYKRNDY